LRKGNRMPKIKTVRELPKCNFCKKDALYDSPTIFNRTWAFTCKTCAKLRTSEEGREIGFEFRLIDSTIPKSEAVDVKVADEKSSMQDIVMDGDRIVECPDCGVQRDVEPDADYKFECEGCGRKLVCGSIM